jgi:hypothetical protein
MDSEGMKIHRTRRSVNLILTYEDAGKGGNIFLSFRLIIKKSPPQETMISRELQYCYELDI